MNILVISSYLPYPLLSGGQIRLYNLLKLLSKKHTLTLICEKREYQTQDDVKALEKFCKKVITVPRKKQWTLENIVKTGFSSYPFLMVGHTNKAFKEEIEKVLGAETFDVIHVETFYIMQNLPKTTLPIVLAEHNIEYLVYKRYIDQLPSFIRPILSIDIFKMKFWENIYWQKATKLVAVSSEEKRIMQRKDVDLVPNGVDITHFKVKKEPAKEKKKILFIGNFLWIQNKDAASWLLQEIWPKIVLQLAASEPKIANSNVVLWIVGKNIPNSIRKLAQGENIIFDEHAPNDTSEIFQQADVLLAPIRVGGGTSFKILEAMACGVPVITTKLGIEGIDAKDNEDVLIGENELELSQKTVSVLQDSLLYKKLSQNARKVMEETFDWEKIVKQLENVYLSVLE